MQPVYIDGEVGMVFVKVATVLTILLSAGLGFSSPPETKSNSTPNLKLAAHLIDDPMAKQIGSLLYTAELSNDGRISEEVEAVQMGGGYAGGGQFYPCSLQIWDDRENRWIIRRRDKLSDFGNGEPPAIVSLKAGEHLKVCGMYLPAWAGRTGDCARFLLRTRWNETNSLKIYSNPFIIGRPVSSDEVSCVRKTNNRSH